MESRVAQEFGVFSVVSPKRTVGVCSSDPAGSGPWGLSWVEKGAKSRGLSQQEDKRSVLKGLKFQRSTNRCSRAEKDELEVCDLGGYFKNSKVGFL